MLLLLFLVFVLVVLLVERQFKSLGMLDDPREQELREMKSWWDTSLEEAGRSGKVAGKRAKME